MLMICILACLLFGIISWVINDFFCPCGTDYHKYLNEMEVTENSVYMLELPYCNPSSEYAKYLLREDELILFGKSIFQK